MIKWNQNRNRGEEYQYRIRTPGGSLEYPVPILKMRSYTIDEIFDKELFLLLPFYIFSHENNLEEYDKDNVKLEKLKAEYEEILDRLDRLSQQGWMGALEKQTIIELSRDVIEELARRYDNVRKGIGDIMGGALLETEARKIWKEGISQGIS